MIEEAILYKYSNIYPNTHFVVKDDGQGEYIAEWNVEDVPQPTKEEIDQWYFEYKKEEKFNILKQSSTIEIYSGFFSATTEHTFEFEEQDQNNFTQQMLLMVNDPAITEVSWKTVDHGIVVLTREEFFAVIGEANAHKRGVLAKYWTLEAQLNNASTVEEIEAITW